MDSVEFIVCRNCSKETLINYYGFCSIWCCVDYSARYNIHFLDAKKICSDCDIDEKGDVNKCDLRNKVENLESENEDLSDEIRKLNGSNAIIEEREGSLESERDKWKDKYKAAQKKMTTLKEEKADLMLALQRATSHSERFQLMVFDKDKKVD